MASLCSGEKWKTPHKGKFLLDDHLGRLRNNSQWNSFVEVPQSTSAILKWKMLPLTAVFCQDSMISLRFRKENMSQV